MAAGMSDKSGSATRGGQTTKPSGHSMCGGLLLKSSLLLAVCAVLVKVLVLPRMDMMKGLSNDVALSPWMVQVAITGFCLTPALVDQYQQEGRKVSSDFLETGEVDEEEYEKASIYAMLYGVYQSVGEVRHTNGELYEFSFNTWGIHNPSDKPYGPDEPQRHGKAAYNKLASSFDDIQQLFAERPNNSIELLEIGCGTGAGANLVSSEVWPQVKRYNALDMQAGAIRKCNTWGNPKLNCVQGNGQTLPFADNSIDIVLVSETHIAEKEIGAEEKAIFAEMKRVLRKGGYFVWGNALPTRVWHASTSYLTSTGWDLKQEFNHTDSAVIARDEDHERVKLYLSQAYSRFPVLSAPFGIGDKCRSVVDMLLRNFFRDVGTDLYLRMVTKFDSYMHQCYRLVDK